ncbi:hypothetical protein DRJ17_05505, partial [Candidatus Woesearchaeota archaeon]
KVELKDKLKNFLIDVLDEMTLRREKDENGKEMQKGLYASWAIWQVKEEILGKEEIEREIE